MATHTRTMQIEVVSQITDAFAAGMEAAQDARCETANKSAITRAGNRAAAAILGCKETQVQAIFNAPDVMTATSAQVDSFIAHIENTDHA